MSRSTFRNIQLVSAIVVVMYSLAIPVASYSYIEESIPLVCIAVSFAVVHVFAAIFPNNFWSFVNVFLFLGSSFLAFLCVVSIIYGDGDFPQLFCSAIFSIPEAILCGLSFFRGICARSFRSPDGAASSPSRVFSALSVWRANAAADRRMKQLRKLEQFRAYVDKGIMTQEEYDAIARRLGGDTK